MYHLSVICSNLMLKIIILLLYQEAGCFCVVEMKRLVQATSDKSCFIHF